MQHLSANSRVEWLSALDTEFTPTQNYRRTSIICTIGYVRRRPPILNPTQPQTSIRNTDLTRPKTNTVEALNKLRTAGLNVARMNFSHGSYEYHQSVIDNVREAEKVQKGRQVAIALDTKGPEIRTGNTTGDADIPISAGTELNITTDDKYATACDDKNMSVILVQIGGLC